MRPERCRSLPVFPVALGDRLVPAPLLAFIVVIEGRALRADDPAATVAIGLEAVLADQRTDPRRLELDRVERVGACKHRRARRDQAQAVAGLSAGLRARLQARWRPLQPDRLRGGLVPQ